MSMPIPPHPYQVPAAPAPSGIVSNLVNPPTNANVATIPLSIFIILAGIFVGLRVYVRFSKASLAKPGWDDYFIITAFPAQVAFTVITIWMCRSGIVSRHIWDTRLGNVLFKLPHWATVIAVLPELIILLVKLSVLSLYYRLFSPNVYVRWGTIIGMAVCTCMYIAFFFIFIFLDVFNSKTSAHLSWAQAAFGVVSDVYILTLPIVAVVKLNIRTRKKIGILAIFLTGTAATALSIVNLFYRVKYSGGGTDPTWDSTPRIVVPVLEIDMGIMCACMPLFAHYSPKSARFEQWLTSLRSIGHGFLGSNRSTVPTNTSVSRGNSSGQVDTGAYYELSDKKAPVASTDVIETTSITNLRNNAL